MENKLKIGLIGLGTVGCGVVKTLCAFPQIEIVKAAVRNLNKKRDVEVRCITDDPFEIVNDPEIDVVVEVAGGVNPAFDLLKTAIKNKKHIVTANKELLAKHGAELFDLANEYNVAILYEAAVAGGIPIIMPIKTTLKGNKFKKVAGILNGTTNYILTQMEEKGISYQECLKEAQELGYAEADPTGDVEGFDTMYKIATLANITFNKRIDVTKIHREGITNISAQDIKFADELGYKIKLIALAQDNDGQIDVRVHPMLVSKSNVISGINNALNAVMLEGFPVGQVMFTGPGAGEFPTASSVVGDILAIDAEFGKCETILPMTRCHHREMAVQTDILDTKNSYYISITAPNAMGVIGVIGTACGENKINISSVLQKGTQKDGTAQIIVITEECSERDIQNAIEELKKQSIKINNLIRVM
ncbi:TPA: homoserine dehydrogenase [Candidatus Galligastranaerophilus intestinavium]|uniref:Homoserine dehydrogenase n=1 Tax=Candidatus Galligastranaerophilus intestinavium TaxID=2840836 RepID=A0A9D1FI31_9BACT|nr:homoserine dehydrogenase [Candidatus Galligastranaerophilus intestinavium]